MTVVYIETSALIKRYIQEIGSDVVDELFDHHSAIGIFAISVLGTLEFKSALARLQRGARITNLERNDLLAGFSSDRPLFSIVLPIGNSLMDEAANSLDDYALRTLGAIHFASALRIKTLADRSNEGMIVVTSDLELVSAWNEEGLAVINPTDDGALGQVRTLSSG